LVQEFIFYGPGIGIGISLKEAIQI